MLSTWYVSAAAGSDGNPGTLNQPLQTIQQAADLAQPGDTVIIRVGTYRETVVPANSGAAAAPITYQAYPGEQVTIDGADPLVGWSSASGSINQAAMPWDLGNGANQVFFDGQMVNEARWPNSGVDLSHPNLALTTSATVKVGANGMNTATIGVPLNDPAGTWIGATIHMSPGQAWVTQTGTVIASAPGSLTYQYQPLTPFEVPTAGNHFYLSGLLRTLDAPDEWFRDAAGNLSLRAPRDADPSSHLIEAKRRLYAFDLSGVSYTNVVGLNLFACTINTSATSANDALDGINARYVSQQTINPYPWTAQDPPHATGIVLNGPGDVIQNSTIRYSSGDGIYLGGTNDTASNNVVSDADYAAGEEAGITDFGAGDQVLGNTVYNCGRSGIVFRHCPNSLIAHNLVHDVGLQETDLGGIYTYGGDTQGTELAYNIVYNIHAGGFGAAGIYLDNNANHLIVDHNLVYNCDFALKMNPPCDFIQVYNNTLIGTAYSVASTNSEEMTGSVLANNIFTAPTQIGPAATESNDLFGATNPLFVNAATGNFQLSPNSPAIDAGMIQAPLTTGYAGAAPDIGAYEYGLPAFSAGSTLGIAPPPAISLWAAGAAPATAQQNIFDPTVAPTGGVELGLKFSSDAPGYVNGVRFYKGTRNTGIHTGELWSAAGLLLATAAFTNETASGWQQVAFSNPVPIAADATYIVSYQDPTGFLAYTGGTFAAAGIDNPPLHAPAGSTPGGNSVYQNDATPGAPAFPATYNGHASNYWVDVVFTTQGTPATPASVTAVANSPTQVTIGWSPSTGSVSAYHVERSVDGVNFTEIAPNVQGASYTDAFAQPGTTYVYRVRAEDNGAFSGYGASAPVATPQPPIAPAAPAGLAVVATTTTSVSLTWSAAAWAAGYQVLRMGPADTSFVQIGTTATTSFTDALAQPATTYLYEVIASNTFGSSLAGQPASATTLPPPVAPSSPTGLVASAVAGQAAISWSAASGTVTAYHVERSVDGVNFVELAGNVQGTTYIDAAVLPGQTYLYQVRAENAGAFSGYAGPQPLTLPPAAPAGLAASVVTWSSVGLSWQPSAGAAQYQVLRLGPSDAAFIPIGTPSATTFTDSQVQPAATYSYEVIALNAGGASPASVLMATTNGLPPDAPSFVSVVAWSPEQAWVVWPLSANPVTAYHVERSGDGVHFSEVAGALATPGFLDIVAPDTTYWYRVRAENSGSYSAYANASPVAMPPLAPTNLTAAGSAGGIALAWTAAAIPDPNLAGYTIFRAPAAGGPFTLLNAAPIAQTSFTDTTAPAGRTSYYQVVAVGASGVASGPAQASAARPLAPISLWSNASAPALSQQNIYDPLAAAHKGVELGLKFRADVAGYVTGVRFWKGSRNTGVHTGELWSAAGQLLATATFTHETASGWQQVSFAQPVPVAANTVYVVSYQDPVGYLAYTPGLLAADINNAPLHAPAGANCVYRLDLTPGTPAFPNAFNGKSSFYWVDVLFSPAQ